MAGVTSSDGLSLARLVAVTAPFSLARKPGMALSWQLKENNVIFFTLEVVTRCGGPLGTRFGKDGDGPGSCDSAPSSYTTEVMSAAGVRCVA